MPDLISQAEYARRQGVSRTAVGKWVKTGLVPLDPDTGKIDPALADAALEANRDTSKTRSNPGAAKARAPKGADESDARPESNLTLARTQREIINAKKAKVELDLIQGALVKTQAVEDSNFEAGRIFRDSQALS